MAEKLLRSTNNGGNRMKTFLTIIIICDIVGEFMIFQDEIENLHMSAVCFLKKPLIIIKKNINS